MIKMERKDNTTIIWIMTASTSSVEPCYAKLLTHKAEVAGVITMIHNKRTKGVKCLRSKQVTTV